MFYGGYHTSDPVATHRANAAQSEAARATTAVQRAEFDIERLLMITEALWTILKEQHGYTDEELQKRVMQIDLRDGKLDGRVAPDAPAKCPKCDRPLAKKRPRCIYCGTETPPGLFGR